MGAWLATLALAAAQSTQHVEINARAEVAWRLRELEEDWGHAGTAENRAEAVTRVETAAQRFFQGDLPGAAEALDLARYDLKAGTSMSPAYEALALVPQRTLLLDSSEKELRAELRWLYGNGTKAFIAVYADIDGRAVAPPIEAGLTPKLGESLGMAISLADVSDGDHTLALHWWDKDHAAGRRAMTISIVARRDARLVQLEKDLAALREKAPRLELETAQMQLALLKALANGSKETHDYPAARLLSQAEQVVAAAGKGERWYGPEHPGEFWLALPIGDGSVRVRVLVPDGLRPDKLAPLVVAFHGASFDEDTLFDGYGGGAILGMCSQRGWLLAAPHAAADADARQVEATIDALAAIYPVDRARTFLVGHSRGAGLALRAYAEAPEHYRGVAAIGGAVSGDALAKLARCPLFLAAGDHDAAREAVEGMHAAVTATGSKSAKLTIYPNVEHWLAVQAALPDVFVWFDALAK